MRRAWSVLAVVVAAAACGGEAPPPARTPTPLDHATTGSIRGEVRFTGEAPAMGEIRFSGFPECAQQHDGPVATGDALVHDGKVANAFVYVKDGLGDRVFAVPPTPVEVDQTGCLYRPHVVGAQVSQPIEFVNDDPLLHNVHGTPTASSAFNVSLGRKGAAREIHLDAAEVMVSIRCDLHPWMQAWVGVVDHPYFAVTGPDGAFALKDVPPGEYTLAVWHERFGRAETHVALAPSGSAVATLTLTATR